MAAIANTESAVLRGSELRHDELCQQNISQNGFGSVPTGQMSWCSSFRCSKFSLVSGKPAGRTRRYDGVPITRSVHDNHYCSANPCFVAVVTECAEGGAFLVLPVRHAGRVEPDHPRVRGHSGRVLDVKWNPFDDLCIASCSEDCTVKIWDIPACGVQQDITRPRKTLIGHSRRVAIIEWHPTAENLLLSSAYDYKVLLWDVSRSGSVIRCPARVVLMPVHHRYPSEALLFSVSFNGDGSRLAVSSRDRRVRVLDPRAGKILQVSNKKTHKANKVLYMGPKMLLSTGTSAWNHRQLVLWDPEDLSEPLFEEDLDGSAGVLFPFYDPDTRMLYVAGKGDGNIRCYELSSEKPYISFLTEFSSLLPQKGLGTMPKRGLDVGACEVFRFYRLIPVKDLVEPLSVVVPRKQAGTFQEDLYPMTAGGQPALTAQDWLWGINRGPVLMSLKPVIENPYAENPADKTRVKDLDPIRAQTSPAGGAINTTQDFSEKDFLEEQPAHQDPRDPSDLSGWQPDGTEAPPPPSELLEVFYRQRDQIRDLEEQLIHKEIRIRQLEGKISRSSTRPMV